MGVFPTGPPSALIVVQSGKRSSVLFTSYQGAYIQILALTLLHIHTLMPLSGLCALERCGLACCGRHGVQRCAPGAGEKPVAFCRTLVLFSQKENSRNCVWVAGGPDLPVNVCAEFSSNL